ncbi:site-2 protease family protein [Chlorobium sp. N1]|uniref:site-2 protease family protein n=1 Tax=Chlorobium sp. N1 TaxID=2491138 RepID=UPI00103F2DBF|nr:site-2 protease family protein [Chlorobium sp. N1]TCD48799.1 site-2 protease family protein [Chlorobium sp. N1]
MNGTRRLALHIGLFLATVLTTLWAGVAWSGGTVRLENAGACLRSLQGGAAYSAGLLTFLTVHEFGHYFASLRHGVRATLPYYIPVPPLPSLLSLGTMGAVIRIRDRMPGTKALLDIGAAGPLSGFMVTLGLLVWGFLALPAVGAAEAHPLAAADAGETIVFGRNLLWIILERLLRPEGPVPMSQLPLHPLLFTGWIGAFVTALNLLPAGQLDGGHVTYAMFGRRGHRRIARTTLSAITLLGLPSMLELLLPGTVPGALLAWSWPGWLLWAAIIWKLLGTAHPPALSERRLEGGRRAAGWLTASVFLLTFTPVPFSVL